MANERDKDGLSSKGSDKDVQSSRGRTAQRPGVGSPQAARSRGQRSPSHTPKRPRGKESPEELSKTMKVLRLAESMDDEENEEEGDNSHAGNRLDEEDCSWR